MKSLRAAAMASLVCVALPCVADPSTTAQSPIARIGAQEIPYSQLQARTDDALAEKQREYDLQLQRLNVALARARSAALETELNKLVDEKVLDLEATARSRTPAQLLNAVQVPAPAESELRAFYDSQRTAVNQSFDAVRPQIDEYLRGVAHDDARRKYLDGLRRRYHAVVLWEPLRETVAASGPQRGPATARVTIVEFSDFQCPFCGRLAPVLKQLQATYPADVRLVFRNFPLRPIHPNAAEAAAAGVCANAQGKFWEMHDAMYADQGGLGRAALEEKAKRLGLDVPSFSACLQSTKTTDAIAADEEAARRLGLSGTPGSFVNGRFFSGALPLSDWRNLVDEELQRTSTAAVERR
ncbi:MAG: thioredoxin domain-containing protein [Steroidobacteraceae bacterium]